jgi:DNA-binding NarL/FixJ family response regulator
VLLSQATLDALEDVDVKDLGEHELKGLPQPERIFQLVRAGADNEFPPLRLVNGLGADAQAEPVGGSSPKAADKLRVALADDAVLLREGIARLLSEAGFDVVGQSDTAEDLLLKVRSYTPDVAVVDIRMPPTQTDEGLRAAQEIRTNHPEVGVLVLSQHVEPTYAMELLAESAEGVGYLLKDRVSDIDEFAAAVRRVAEGGSALDPSLVTQLVGRRRKRDPIDELTPREREVLELMAEGRSNQAIGERLFITPRAVEKHITSIFGKLGLPPAPEDHRRVLAVLAFLRS